MWHWWWGFWWLIFPVGFFIFGAWDRWLQYQRSRDTLEVLKHYTAQGKDPPPELLRRVQDDQGPDPYDDGYRPYRYRRRYRRYYRYGRFWQWRSAVVTGAVAAGFWVASYEDYIPGTEGPFRFVAIILTCVAAANLALALVSMTFRDPDRDADR